MRRNMGFLLIGVGVLALLYYFNPVGVFSWNGLSFKTQDIHLEKTAEGAPLQNIIVETGSADARIVKGEGNQVNVRLDGSVSKKQAEKFQLKVDSKGDTLSVGIEEPSEIGVGVTIVNVELVVELPEKNWNSVRVQSGSGNIELESLKGNAVETKAGSGDTSLREIKSDKLVADAGSGAISVTDVQGDAIMLKADSGDIRAEQYAANSLKFEGHSGNVELKQGKASLQGETHSGDIRLEAGEILRDADLKSGSGNVKIELSEEPKSLAVDFEGGSGNGSVDWENFSSEEKNEKKDRLKGKFGSGEVKLKVRTGSGDFHLVK
ncbi:DUF4097 family beta strand repeat-containing protein [Paenibacillus sp. 1P03SA]|uniref:DUF4097 family beta strand repeat-containing protein n=1 Tax=Paenibacillus sp. 1P03SA TaxID=3132294 RepID=UPI0039A2B0AC